MRADLRAARWVDDTLVIEGWITVQGRKRMPPHPLSVWVVPLSTHATDGDAGDSTGVAEEPAPLHLRTTAAPDLNPNGFVASDYDLSTGTFSAELPVSAWDERGTADLQVVVRYGPSQDVTPLTHRYRWGSAGHLTARISHGSRYAPRWQKDLGLCVRRSSPAAFTRGRPVPDSDSITVPIRLANGFQPVRADWAGQDAACPAGLTLSSVTDNEAELSISAPDEPLTTAQWSIALTDADGSRRLLHWDDPSWDTLPLGETAVLSRRAGGLVRLVGGPSPITLDDVTVTDAQIIATVTSSSRARVSSMTLRGSRLILHGDDRGDGRYSFTLAHASWRKHVEAPPAGGYRLWAADDSGAEVPVAPVLALSQATPLQALTEHAALRVEHAPDGQVYVDVSAPLRDDERGRFHQKRLAAAFTGDQHESAPRVAEGVFLESWYGKTFSDNPAPLVTALRAAGVPGPYRVAVADHSVEVPDDVEAVIVRSTDYWRALGSSRVLVFNTWLPSEFRKRAGQFIVQTWHGTPLKSLGMDVPSRQGSARSAERLREGSQDWDLLVSQNSYSTAIFRRAYVYDGDVAETGYPRNDILTNEHSTEVRARTRQLLGVSEHNRLILYAPTWRQADKGSVGPLAIEQFVRLLSSDDVIAVRGHSVTLRRGDDIAGDRMIDVTSYPELAELIAAADALVTDYSSVMFDFAATGKPIVYYTPDYEQYLSEGRGGYFDLAESAPGPLAQTPEELASAVTDALSDSGVTQRYVEWQQKFVPHDDGAAAQRLARRIASALD